MTSTSIVRRLPPRPACRESGRRANYGRSPIRPGDQARVFGRDLRLDLWREQLDRADDDPLKDALDPTEAFSAAQDSAAPPPSKAPAGSGPVEGLRRCLADQSRRGHKQILSRTELGRYELGEGAEYRRQ